VDFSDTRDPAPPRRPNGPGGAVLAAVDRVADACARLGDVVVVAIAVMLFYEVTARYLFLAPTIWAQDVAVTLQIWFTYLGMAYVLRRRQLIRITAVMGLAGPAVRKALEAFALLVIAAFSVVAVVHAVDVVADSVRLGRRQPTMLELPNWISEIPVVLGFALLFLQAAADLVRLPWRPAPSVGPVGEHAVGPKAEVRPAGPPPDGTDGGGEAPR